MDKTDKKRGVYLTESSKKFLYPILFVIILMLIILLSIQLYEKGIVGRAFQIISGEAAAESGEISVIKSSTLERIRTQEGNVNWIPAVADYDRDGKADFAWFNPATEAWKIFQSSSGYNELIPNPILGGTNYIPISGDFDGDGYADIAVVRQTDSKIKVNLTNNKSLIETSFVSSAMWKPAAADYNGDGATDFAWFDPATQRWKIWQSNIISKGCESNNDCQSFCNASRLYSMGACSGCSCAYLNITDCNSLDGDYNTGETGWIDETQCTVRQQQKKEHRDYSCSSTGCSISNAFEFWVNTTTIAPKNDGTLCNDNLFCTAADRCLAGVCSGTSESSCNDGISCTNDACNEQTDSCMHTANNSRCDDGISCSIGVCDLSGSNDGCSYNYNSCECTQNSQCAMMNDECNQGICGSQYTCIKLPKNEGGSCGAGQFCLVGGICRNGNCAGTENNCAAQDRNINQCNYNPDGNPLTLDNYIFNSVCDEENNICPTMPLGWENLITHACNKVSCGALCDTNNDCANKCLSNKFYENGVCAGCSCSYDITPCSSDGWYDTPNDEQWISLTQCTEKKQKQQEYRDYSCSSSNGCYFNVIGSPRWIDIAGETRNKQDGTLCNDNLFCAENDRCYNGVCAGVSKLCNDNIGCTTDTCSEASQMCIYTPNNNLCASGISCSAVSCSAANGCVYDYSSCECNSDSECAGDQCNAGKCNMITHSCYKNPANEGNSCNDGEFCTVNEKCASGICRNGITKDCSANNINVQQCNYTFDGNNMTWDYYSYASTCDEAMDRCSSTINFENEITHSCRKESCNAECETNNDCPDTSCSNLSKCVERDFYYYADVKNTCNNGCACTKNPCGAPLVMPEDNRCRELCPDGDKDSYHDKFCGGEDCNDGVSAINPNATEIWNGVDDNCNLLIDEGFPNFCSIEDAPRQCGISDIGECGFGQQTCNLGTWSLCAGDVNPINEFCDGKDNDCNNAVDDGLTRPFAEKQLGICAGARMRCDGANGWINDYSYISGYQADETLCDRNDNDCDGRADEGCCGNEECEQNENYAICPQDCSCEFEWACLDRNQVGARNIDCRIDVHNNITSRFGVKRCLSECVNENCADAGIPASCADSDYGANLEIKGTAVLIEAGVETKIEDYCLSQSDYLVEARCGMNAGKVIIYTEMKGCGDGKKCQNGICADINLICQDSSDCEDSNDCTDDICINGLCSFSNDNTNLCNDELFCTENDRCVNGVCAGNSKICNDGFACTADTCNEINNDCDYNRISCTCLTDAECNDNNPCTDNLCINQTCVFTNDNTNNCSDMWCTTNNTCRNGSCVGQPKNCNDSWYYTIDSCSEERDECSHESILPVLTGFSREITTNVSNDDIVENISKVTDFSIGIFGKARIEFKEDVDLTQLNLARDIILKKAYAEIKGESLARLRNKNTTITMYNITFKEPKILMNGRLCAECEKVSYEDDVFVFTVPHWTIYSVIEGFAECRESWTCGSYLPEECPSTGIQRRTCEDKNNCGTIRNMPEEEKRCSYIPAVVPTGNCYDGIRNQDENGIDCGGKCPACPITEQPAEQKNNIWIYVSLILMISSILGGTGIVAYEQKKKAKLKEYTDRLRDYIEKSLGQGYRIEQIERQLITEGWQKEIIEEILKNGKK